MKANVAVAVGDEEGCDDSENVEVPRTCDARKSKSKSAVKREVGGVLGSEDAGKGGLYNNCE
jgi:hypothetical protein